ncbi:transcriptional regulator, Spx/MgsR family [Spongiibacter sp. IMCC21906]|uniref:ArsC family reductase n=1 Tax=Spongiibacter sp. IMCC21906 TaxID=1620392 RepID=UPI00062DEEFD|nr:ArsC family reductase [Spongiibacter sp. IMCC21906]AKH70293.1 transcriptional regulator, Spx/MgsR family [Spongiibacter sp. IMCC21906]
MTVILYGIKNCDTVRAARKWLDAENIEHQFHDVREQALSEDQLNQWLDKLGDKLINKRSTTWKQLDEADREQLSDRAAKLLLAHPTLMKRPLLDTGKELHLGFKDTDYQRIFTHHTL